MSRPDLARYLGLSERTVQLVERDKQNFGSAAIDKLKQLQQSGGTNKTLDLEAIAGIACAPGFGDKVQQLADLLGVDLQRAWVVIVGEQLRKRLP